MSATAHGVSHLGIGVTDLDRSVAFYRDVLGFELVDRYGYHVPSDPTLPGHGNARPDPTWWREVAVLRVGRSEEDQVVVLALHHPDAVAHVAQMDDVGTHHWGFWVTGIDDYVRRLDEAGVEYAVPLRTFESARAWGLPEGFGMRSCIVRDPDGTMVQLDERVPTEAGGPPSR